MTSPYHGLADEIIYSRFLKEQDETLLAELLDRHGQSLVLFLNGMVQNMEDAEELMLDSFAVIASGTVHYTVRKDSTFKTWLFAIARNKAKMLLRKRKFVFTSIDEEVLADKNLPESEVFDKEERKELYKALSEINKDYRQVLYLTYFEDMKPEEIARVLNKSIKQIYNLTARGREALKTVLLRNGFREGRY
ncbi:MAG: sigma-70 family RNA polymerase sigma factor [Lachnospiraceae bacterium]|nr:sigma-70 family RNA polymerase sigma factor [Lachnospiraceae bacterium]MBR6303167.1 sigma-70 family RNA polymerase sigma factor [Lachnospiraceae bacterium]